MTKNKPKYVGFTCAYTPIMLINAAGFTPFRVLPISDSPEQSGRLLHDNLCPHIKRVLDRALDGDLPDLSGMVFINSCDAMRRLADAWRKIRPHDNVILLDLPATAKESNISFYAGEISRLWDMLNQWSGEETEIKSINLSISKYDTISRLLQEVACKIRQGELPGGSANVYYLGIDIGSLTCDAVIIDDLKNILASIVVSTGANNQEAIRRANDEAVKQACISENDLKATVSTGYGRERVDKRSWAVTEITCHARGIIAHYPQARILVDIGGQDSKAILLDENGMVVDFAMNDKCAAGTGRFLEAMARALQVDITELGELDHGAKDNLTLSSMCTVFAESEVVSLIAEGVNINEIVRGLNRSIASRTHALVKRILPDHNGLHVAMSGGVAQNKGVIRALGAAMGTAIFVPDQPDTVGALGAALIARERSA